MCQTLNTDELFDFDRDLVPRPTENLIRFAHRTVANRNTAFSGDERRSEPRHAVAVPVLAIPLDKDFRPFGEPFIGISRDVSAHGIAIFHDEHVRAKHLVLEIADPSGEPLRMILAVLRSERVGMFYEVAGKFVKKLTANAQGEVSESSSDAGIAQS
jgi:hypothetical protein